MSLIKSRYTPDDLREFAEYLQRLQRRMNSKASARGWAYILEGERLINKDQFDRVANLINKCRKEGYLPVDFVAEEVARQFHGVELPEEISVTQDFAAWLRHSLRSAEIYNLDWWEDEEYYIQCIVEKVDLIRVIRPGVY